MQSMMHGATWPGLTSIVVTVDGVPPASALASAVIQFRKTPGGFLGYELSTAPAAGQGELVIEDADTWTISAPQQELPLSVGEWYFQLLTIDADDVTEKYWSGTITICQDIAR